MAFGQPLKAPVAADLEVGNPPTDSIQCMSFAPSAPMGSDFLAVGSWSNEVRVYEINSQGQSQPKASYSHEGPVLALIWSPDASKIISGGADNAARMYDVASGQAQQVAQHDQPIKAVRWVSINGSPECHLVTGSWDRTLKYWDLRSPTPIASVSLPERLYSMDVSGNYLVAGCADRHNIVYNLNADPSKPYKSLRSTLKWQTRVIRCFPQGTANPGFAIGGIEGRVGVYYIDGTDADNYSFKCHRVDQPNKPPGLDKPNANIYAVNDLPFSHLGTVASCGADGSFSFWDLAGKQRLKEVPDRGGPITCGSFNNTGNIFAYALSYDWGQGHQGNTGQLPTKIMLHACKEEDIAKRKKK